MWRPHRIIVPDPPCRGRPPRRRRVSLTLLTLLLGIVVIAGVHSILVLRVGPQIRVSWVCVQCGAMRTDQRTVWLGILDTGTRSTEDESPFTTVCRHVYGRGCQRHGWRVAEWQEGSDPLHPGPAAEVARRVRVVDRRSAERLCGLSNSLGNGYITPILAAVLRGGKRIEQCPSSELVVDADTLDTLLRQLRRRGVSTEEFGVFYRGTFSHEGYDWAW